MTKQSAIDYITDGDLDQANGGIAGHWHWNGSPPPQPPPRWKVKGRLFDLRGLRLLMLQLRVPRICHASSPVPLRGSPDRNSRRGGYPPAMSFLGHTGGDTRQRYG